jgi:hypothetical protein
MGVFRIDRLRTDGTAALDVEPRPQDLDGETMTRDLVAEPRPTREDAWQQRRLRVIARRRVRVPAASMDVTAQIASDGDLVVALETVRARDPRIIGWRASREVELVVVHDACGARAVGGGGISGQIELPGALGPDDFIAFCYDTDPGPASL